MTHPSPRKIKVVIRFGVSTAAASRTLFHRSGVIHPGTLDCANASEGIATSGQTTVADRSFRIFPPTSPVSPPYRISPLAVAPKLSLIEELVDAVARCRQSIRRA